MPPLPAQPNFPLDVVPGFGVRATRQGAAWRFDLDEEPIRTSGSGRVFRVQSPVGRAPLKNGLVIPVQADRDYVGAPLAQIDDLPALPWLDADGSPLTRVVGGRGYRLTYDETVPAFRSDALSIVRNAALDAMPALSLKGNGRETAAGPEDISIETLATPGNPLGDAINASAASGWRVASFAGAGAATIPIFAIRAFIDDRGASYRRVATEPAHPLKFFNGSWWEIDERRLDVRMAGFVTGPNGNAYANAAAVQACIDYCYEQLGGEVHLPAGFHNCAPIIMRDRVFLVGPGMTDCYITLPNGANSDFVKSAQYDEFADGVKRSYLHYTSTELRNAASRPLNSFAMVAATQTDFKNARWYRATKAGATIDADWVPCGAVIGMVGGGVRGFSILGNRQNQSGSFWGLALYGVGIHAYDVEVRNASKAIHFDCPGALLAPIGFTAQWSVSKLQWREFDKEGFFNNMQSDGTVTDIKGAGSESPVIDYMLKFGPKATGQKWFGGHIWGGNHGSAGIIFEGSGNTLVAVECERPIIIEATAGGTSYTDGKIYRINALSAEAGPAVTIRANVNSCVIETRVSHYRYAIKFEGPIGLAHKIDMNYYSEDADADFFDPTGITSPSAMGLLRNQITFRPSFGKLFAQLDYPRIRASIYRTRFATISGSAGTISPDANSSQLYRCLGLSANMVVNNPINGEDGDEIEFYFGQDATGGRTVTFGSSFRGASASSGGVFLYRVYRFRFNGVYWVYSGGTGVWV